ncbi:OmpA family protein [Flavobacterium limnophilum]|uniref:OmpA family protein n=1 Tax=Flavobacterium limnophilum TaxID=3003262 RepID=UPI002482F21B|nr:OmpA family protein [Flavobacterium limnophilum]
MKKLLFLCVAIAFTFTSRAQTEDKKWNVGLHAGVTQYSGDLGRDWYKTDNSMYGFGGLSVSRYLGKLFDVNLLLSKGTMGYHNGTTAGFRSDFNAVSINLRFNIVAPEYIIRPYVFAGAGAIQFDNTPDFHHEKYDFMLPSTGAGINIRLTPVIMLNLQETFMFSNHDGRDGVDNAAGKMAKKDSYVTHMAGLTFNMGNSVDTDQDGVSDKKDTCPGTPVGVTVDKMGCPLDKDADGVPDYMDNCPDIAGSKMLNGCPDKDNDGVEDSKDQCPDQAGTVALNGCPDTDKDGIADKEDKCPTVAGPKENGGCPVLDADKDGVADKDDDCPSVAGSISNRGCPEVTTEVIEKLKIQARSVFFNTGKSTFKTGDAATITSLDAMREILRNYPNAKFSIEGHTDSDGSNAFNQKLSEDRANAVRNALIEKGVKPDNLTAVGFGESKPVASNKTKTGKAQNRRTEVKHVGSIYQDKL